MNILETRHDGTILCILTPEEAAALQTAPLPIRKWCVKGHTAIGGVFASLRHFEYVIRAATCEEAEAEARARALRPQRDGNPHVVDIGSKDVTGMTKGFFGGWN